MVNQDMQAALGVTSYQGKWALILDSVGPHTVPGRKTDFGKAGSQTVLSFSTYGGDGLITYFPHVLSVCFCYQGRWALILDSVGELGPTLSLQNNSCFLMADKN